MCSDFSDLQLLRFFAPIDTVFAFSQIIFLQQGYSWLAFR